jgi:hypothetical protein
MRWLVAAWLVAAAGVFAGEARVWVDRENRKVEAELAGLDGGQVILKLKDGRKIPYPLEKLSVEDAASARQLAAAGKGAGESVATADAVGGDRPNFDASWPDKVRFTGDPEIVVIAEDAGASRFVYESANYRYTSDVRLAKTVVKGFAVLFEATYEYCRALPLGLDGGERTDGKLQVLLFENFEDYVAQGGPEDSAGVFLGGKNVVLVPLTSLGVRPVGNGYMLDRDKSSKTLPHELTHQLTPRAYHQPGSEGWFIEGIAEYVATTPYRAGTYSVKGNVDEAVEFVTGYGTRNSGGRALGTKLRLPSLEKFLLQDYDGFLKLDQTGYGGVLLLAHYFLGMDGDKDAARVKAFLRRLREGQDGPEAVAALLDGRSYEALELEIARAWKRHGVEITFGPR